MPPASLVTLSGKLPLDEALAAIRTRTGIEVRPPAAASTATPKTVELDLSKQPFWVALEEIARQTDTHIVVGNSGATISLAPGKETRKSKIDGPFRTVPKEVRLTRELIGGQSHYLLISETHWEPKFPVFRIDNAPANATGSDDRKTPLTAINDRTRAPVTGYSTTTETRIVGPTRASQSISTFRGELTATLASGMQVYTFDATESTGDKTTDGVRVTVERTRSGGFTSFKLTSRYPKGFPPFESYEESLWQKNNALTLIAPDGTRHTTANTESSGTTDGATTTWRFSDAKTGWKAAPAAGWKVEFSTPTMVREATIRVELSEIGLP